LSKSFSLIVFWFIWNPPILAVVIHENVMKQVKDNHNSEEGVRSTAAAQAHRVPGRTRASFVIW
jgi:hypothetical protein